MLPVTLLGKTKSMSICCIQRKSGLQMIQDMLVLQWGMNNTEFSPEALKYCNSAFMLFPGDVSRFRSAGWGVTLLRLNCWRNIHFCFRFLLGCLQNSKLSLLLALTLENFDYTLKVFDHDSITSASVSHIGSFVKGLSFWYSVVSQNGRVYLR